MNIKSIASSILMPLPSFIEDKEGFITITSNSGIKCAKKFYHVRELILDQFSFVSRNEIIEFVENDELSKEEYFLNITLKNVVVTASSSIGIFHGMQTLRQLMLSCGAEIPCCEIRDKPMYSWRGFMIDCSRHFFSLTELKKMIDVASLHHLNVFHWHLTDDQGWRLEIPSLPKLTQIGAIRQNINYEVPMIEHEYYTEAQVADLIDYAQKRFITVVPEIEFPGHSRSLLASYPQYGCVGENYSVVAHWGIFEDVLCVGNDFILDLIKEIITYVAKVFPSEYIHIGGDECPTESWKSCPKCQQKMKQLNITDERGLQSYITSEICKIVAGLNKIPIGWDEVLDGTENMNLPEDLIVMSWRGTSGGKKASALNHKAIMCPNNAGCYFDYKNYNSFDEPGNLGVITLNDVSQYSPISSDMSEKQKKMILGGQGNIWSEKIPFGKNLEYMAYPRLSVLAERLWNPQDIISIERRKSSLIHRLRKLDINCYAGPSI